MERSDYDYIEDSINRIKEQVDEATNYIVPEDEVVQLKYYMEHIVEKLNQMNDLDNCLCNINNYIVDLQEFLNNNKPNEEEKRIQPKVVRSSSEEEEKKTSSEEPEESSPSTASMDSPTEEDPKLVREQLPFVFLRRISHSAYLRYYTAYKESKELITKMNPKNTDDRWNKIFLKIVLPVPDAKTLYLNLQEANDYIDTIELTKKFGKTFVRFYKIFRKMINIAKTYSQKKQ